MDTLHPGRDNYNGIPRQGQNEWESLITPTSFGGIVLISASVIGTVIVVAHVLNSFLSEGNNTGRREGSRIGM